MTEVLQIDAVAKHYGQLAALKGVSLSVERGQLHGLIGPNGSGKSTLLKCIAGAEIASSGRIVFDGRDITRLPADRRARAGLCLKFQVTSILPLLSVYDNVLLAVQRGTGLAQLVASRSRAKLREEVVALLKAINLHDRADTPAEALSHGQQQWLEMAMALGQRPSLLLLDEPTAGMNREERQVTGELLKELARDTTVILVEHDLDFVKRMCSLITVLDQGRVIGNGTADEIEQDENVKGVFIGRG